VALTPSALTGTASIPVLALSAGSTVQPAALQAFALVLAVVLTAEHFVHAVAAAERLGGVSAENRVGSVLAESRTGGIPAENRNPEVR
jgi:multisubunit Na+/H+ antiporter MnhG subunit